MVILKYLYIFNFFIKVYTSLLMKLLLLLSITILLGTPDGFTNEDVRGDIPVNDAASTGLPHGELMMTHSDDSWTVQDGMDSPIHNSGKLPIKIILTAVHTFNTTQRCILGVTN